MKIVIGILDTLVGTILVSFIVMLQGISFFVVLGVLYVILGLKVLMSKKFRRLMLWGIIPLTILSIFSTIMLGTSQVPEGFRIPLLMQIIFIVVLAGLCLANYYYYKTKTTKK
jgi:hypothetical protein